MKARDAAVTILSDARAGRRTARRSLDELLGRYRIAPADLGLAGELVWGVMRHRLTLEAVLRIPVGDRWERLSATLRHILLVAAYQLIWLDRVPAFAAVNEAVEQAKREGGRRAGGFVNAALRTLQRHIAARNEPGPAPDPRTCVPTGPDRHCRFDVRVLPDPAADPVGYLSAVTSHPRDLVRRWIEAFGRDPAEQICRAGTLRPPVVLRPNLLRTDATRLARRLEAEGCRVTIVDLDLVPPTAVGHTAAVAPHEPSPSGPVWRLASAAEGLFQPQDITAMKPVLALGIRSGMTVLDLCAGYGTKATQAAEHMGDRGLVIATDPDADKLLALSENSTRLGLGSVRCVPFADVDAAIADQARLDAIIVDVPCTNTGVLGRRPEARYRFANESLRRIAAIQESLLDRAASLARAETRLCYSTCSLEREENAAITDSVCLRHPDWHIVRSEMTLPHPDPIRWHDGGYFAVLAR